MVWLLIKLETSTTRHQWVNHRRRQRSRGWPAVLLRHRRRFRRRRSRFLLGLLRDFCTFVQRLWKRGDKTEMSSSSKQRIERMMQHTLPLINVRFETPQQCNNQSLDPRFLRDNQMENRSHRPTAMTIVHDMNCDLVNVNRPTENPQSFQIFF